MSEAEREQFLKQANVAILATVGPAGAHAVPIWYLYENGAFLMSTGRGSQKHRDLERNPNVTLVVDRRALPYYAVVAGGGGRPGAGRGAPPPHSGALPERRSTRGVHGPRAGRRIGEHPPDATQAHRVPRPGRAGGIEGTQPRGRPHGG